MRKSRTPSKKKSGRSTTSTIRKNIGIAVGVDNDIETFKQSIVADLSDIAFIPRMIRLLSLYFKKNDDLKTEESFWNHTAKVIVGGIGGTAIMFGTGLLIPFGYVLKTVTTGSNAKLWLKRHPEFEKKLEKDETFKAQVTDMLVDVINTITITTDKKGGIAGVTENVVKQT